jgi:hypothetical protein
LFAADRRPVVPKPKRPQSQPPNVEEEAAAPPEQLQLVGIVQGSAPRALIRSKTNGEGTWMAVGEDVEGWRLSKVADNMAMIETGGRSYELHLYPDQPSSGEP